MKRSAKRDSWSRCSVGSEAVALTTTPGDALGGEGLEPFVGQVESAPPGVFEVVRVAPGFGGGRAREFPLGRAFLWEQRAAGEVAVAAQSGPARGGAARAADVDGQCRGLVGFGELDEFVEGEEFASVVDAVVAAGP